MEKIEILAPAGNLENFNVALNCGADAVYLGLQGFNARARAENFTTENIAEIVKKAHLFGVKVYVTTNTLVSDDEMPKLIETVRACVDAKADAFLVQDFGVLAVLKHYFQGITLHASTQMGIHNLAGAKIAEKLGIKRVVLSRETKLEDIKLIKQHTNLEIEYFVQGALCVAFSGNCYLSSYLTGESGNRGKCKQLCRLPYFNNLTGAEGYFLSPSDLCLLKNIKILKEAGVSSFKIEGRLRRAGYVGQAVTSYKKAVELLEQGGLETNFIEQEKQKLKKVFSRGDFNENAYLFGGTPDKIIDTKCNNHTGTKIGKIVQVKQFKPGLKQIVVQSTHKLCQNDGLKFFENGKEVGSLGVGNVEVLGRDLYRIYSSSFVKENWTVNLILDSSFESKFQNEKRKLKINAKVTAKLGQKLRLELSFQNINATLESDFVCQEAKTSKTDFDEIKTQVAKLGEDFSLDKIEITADNVFLPKSVLNELRRNTIKILEEKIIAENEKEILVTSELESKNGLQLNDVLKNQKDFELNGTSKNSLPFEKIYVFDDLTQTQNLGEENLFVYAPKVFDVENVKNMSKKHKNFGILMPIFANYKDFEILEQIAIQNPNAYLVVNNLYGFVFDNPKIAGTGLNIYNTFSKTLLEKLGAKFSVLSFEQKPENVQGFVYNFVGKPSLMTFCHCPYKTTFQNTCDKCSFKDKLILKTQAGREFAVRRYKISNCYFELVADKKLGNINNFSFVDLR